MPSSSHEFMQRIAVAASQRLSSLLVVLSPLPPRGWIRDQAAMLTSGRTVGRCPGPRWSTMVKATILLKMTLD